MSTSMDRRQVLATAALAGAGVGAAAVLSSCATSGQAPAPAATSAAASVGSTGAAAPPAALGSVADAPVGSGFVAADAPIVVTQPQAGQFKAFSAICTHAGCLVSEVASNQIMCPCHGSVFSAEDGSVIVGPATEPLAPVAITVQGEAIIAS